MGSQDDQPMSDAAADAPEAPEPAIVESLAEQRIRVLAGATHTAASFEFEGEDHTLGNALRYIIMKKFVVSKAPASAFVESSDNLCDSPDVEFCGYSIPHPSEAKMNVRIQTYDGTTAIDALEKGLSDLMGLCDVVVEKFNTAREVYRLQEM
ncbi:MAG: RNA polymerase subunit AC19 [Piccolia ochrophora]|nr:MAG: RNA polymerase subunit AC19 [Piccolia ochrophora]